MNFSLSGHFAFEKGKSGIRFTEKMVGTFWLAQKKDKKRTEEASCELTVTVQSDDVERMLKFDPAHSAKMTGTLTCPVLSTTPMTINEGKVTRTCFRIACVTGVQRGEREEVELESQARGERESLGSAIWDRASRSNSTSTLPPLCTPATQASFRTPCNQA